MNGITLFSSKLRVYLTEIPPILIMLFAIHQNDNVTTPLKLYPLIIVMGASIIFIAIFFFRAVCISVDEVRTIGLFSSRECVEITKDRELVITKLPKRRLKIELFGDGGDAPTFAWLKNDTPTVINLFRAKACGSTKAITKVLKYFEVDLEDISDFLNAESYSKEYENITVKSSVVNENREVRIFFKETV